MSGPRIYLRTAGRPDRDWEPIDLPSPREAGIAAQTWSEVSVSTALGWIQHGRNPALAYLLSCRRGLCDVCAIRVDGVVVTACTTPVRNGMRIEPTKDKLALTGTIVEISLVRRARYQPPAETKHPLLSPSGARGPEESTP